MHAHAPSWFSPRFASNRGKIFRAVYVIFTIIKTMSVLTVGIGMKLALLNPLASGFYSSDQRLLVGLALFLTFALQMLLKPLHEGLSYYTSASPSVAPRLFICLASRVGLVASMLAVFTTDLLPHAYMGLQAALCFGVVLTMRAEGHVRYHDVKQPHRPHKFSMMASHRHLPVQQSSNVKPRSSNVPKEMSVVSVGASCA